MFRLRNPISPCSAACYTVIAACAVLCLLVSDLRAGTAKGGESEFVWAGDPEGGAPFVEANPQRPDDVAGFDVEVADLIARGLGRKAVFININFSLKSLACKQRKTNFLPSLGEVRVDVGFF